MATRILAFHEWQIDTVRVPKRCPSIMNCQSFRMFGYVRPCQGHAILTSLVVGIRKRRSCLKSMTFRHRDFPDFDLLNSLVYETETSHNQRKMLDGSFRGQLLFLKIKAAFALLRSVLRFGRHLFLKTKRPLPEPTSRGAYIRQPSQAHESLPSA
jgi:hypothetical protein